MKSALVILGLLPALAWGAAAPKAPAKPVIPGIDWNARTIKATGRGAPSLKAPSVAAARIGAERAAELDALRNILSTLEGLRISSEKTVADAMNADDSLRARVQGAVRGFKRVDTRYFSDGGVEIDVEMSLEGMLPELLGHSEETPAPTLPSKGERSITGLVIDASGLKPAPALAPRILDESGKEVYTAQVVGQEALKSNGIAGYLKSLEEAKKSARVGEKPLVIKAVKRAGASDLVISDADAKKLLDPAGNATYLAEGRVIIVAD